MLQTARIGRSFRSCLLAIGVLWSFSTVSAQEDWYQDPHELRLFVRVEGAVEFAARWVELDGNRVTLEQPDGQLLELRMAELSNDDQVWIRATDRRNRVFERERERVAKQIEELAEAEPAKQIRICVELRGFGPIAAEAVPILEHLMTAGETVELRYHALISYALLCERTVENLTKVVLATQGDNGPLAALIEQQPLPVMLAISRFGKDSFPYLRQVALKGRLPAELPGADASTSAETLLTAVGTRNNLRAAGLVALGETGQPDAVATALACGSSAGNKINGVKDDLSILAALRALGTLGISSTEVTRFLDQYKSEFKAEVTTARSVIDQRRKLKAAIDRAARLEKFRVFTDRSGVAMRLEFIEFKDQLVRLRDIDGKNLVFSIEQFSDADQQWIREKTGM